MMSSSASSSTGETRVTMEQHVDVEISETMFEGRKLTECTVTTGTSELVLKGEDQHDVVCVHARSVRFFAARDRLL